MQLPSPRQRKSFEKAASRYETQLASDTAAQEFLISRGISASAAVSFRLGVVRDPILGHRSYQGRLAIPFITPAGVVNFVFRCITIGCAACKLSPKDGGHPKYLAFLPERTMYNVQDLATPGQEIHVTEGEVDALILSMCGFPAVGVGGVKAWKPYFTICLRDFETVYAWGDGDKDGRAFNQFLKTEIGAIPVPVPNQEDVNSVYLASGVPGLSRLLAE